MTSFGDNGPSFFDNKPQKQKDCISKVSII